MRFLYWQVILLIGYFLGKKTHFKYLLMLLSNFHIKESSFGMMNRIKASHLDFFKDIGLPLSVSSVEDLFLILFTLWVMARFIQQFLDYFAPKLKRSLTKSILISRCHNMFFNSSMEQYPPEQGGVAEVINMELGVHIFPESSDVSIRAFLQLLSKLVVTLS